MGGPPQTPPGGHDRAFCLRRTPLSPGGHHFGILEPCNRILEVQHSQGWGIPSSPLSARIAIFSLEVQPSQGWGTPSSSHLVRITIFSREVQPSQGWGHPAVY